MLIASIVATILFRPSKTDFFDKYPRLEVSNSGSTRKFFHVPFVSRPSPLADIRSDKLENRPSLENGLGSPVPPELMAENGFGSPLPAELIVENPVVDQAPPTPTTPKEEKSSGKIKPGIIPQPTSSIDNVQSTQPSATPYATTSASKLSLDPTQEEVTDCHKL